MGTNISILYEFICDRCGRKKEKWIKPVRGESDGRIPYVTEPSLWFHHDRALLCDNHRLEVIDNG